MKPGMIVILALTMLAVSACVVEPYGYGYGDGYGYGGSYGEGYGGGYGYGGVYGYGVDHGYGGGERDDHHGDDHDFGRH